MLVAGEARRGWETGERLGGPSWWQEFYCPLSELKCVLWPPEALVRAWRGQLTGPASQASWCRELGQASEPPDVSRCKPKMAASEEETQM